MFGLSVSVFLILYLKILIKILAGVLKIKKRSYNTVMHYSQGFKMLYKFAIVSYVYKS